MKIYGDVFYLYTKFTHSIDSFDTWNTIVSCILPYVSLGYVNNIGLFSIFVPKEIRTRTDSYLEVRLHYL